MKRFDKYEQHGDYHWKTWKDPQALYSRHALFCSGWVKERPVLDVGCGDGLITSLLGKEAVGVDASTLAIQYARSHGVQAMVGDVYELYAFVPYEAVFMGDIIEHLDRPGLALRNVRQALKPGGFLYISTPPKQKVLSEYHWREYTPAQLKTLVEAEGFTLDGAIIVKPELVQMYGKFRNTGPVRTDSSV